MKKFYLFREPLAIVIFLGGLAIALFSPTDVLDRLPWIRNISTPLSEIFPPIRFYAQKSMYPQIAELYFTVMWILSPLTFYWLGKDFSEKTEPVLAKWKNDYRTLSIGKKLNVIFCILIILPSLIYFCWFLNRGYDLIWLPINSSVFALGTGGYFLAGTGGWWALQVEAQLIRKVYVGCK